ncbi:hypothetical protein B296_00029308 [Ensete ventricosum]|uniref:Uncharacterized protein n=1 Tax=Ensete ventricosum TaxID=4639 RepID=A0A426YKC0_ENSVE|nr:hypothetical protein B296_00029308 [Ensete ventricosum]
MGAGCQDGWKQQIWFGIARLDAQATAEAGLSWPRLPLGRIRHCGCRRGELGPLRNANYSIGRYQCDSRVHAESERSASRQGTRGDSVD